MMYKQSQSNSQSMPCSIHLEQQIAMICMEPDPYEKKKICVQCLLEDDNIQKQNAITLKNFTIKITELIESVVKIKNSQSLLLRSLIELDKEYRKKMGIVFSQIHQEQESLDKILRDLEKYTEQGIVNSSDDEISYQIQLLKKQNFIQNWTEVVKQSINHSSELNKNLIELIEKTTQDNNNKNQILGIKDYSFINSEDIGLPSSDDQEERQQSNFFNSSMINWPHQNQIQSVMQDLSQVDISTRIIQIIVIFERLQKTYNIELIPDTLIGDLIYEFQQIFGPVQLYFNNILLHEQETFQELGIQDGQILKGNIIQKKHN